MNYFDQTQIKQIFSSLGKILLYLIVTLFVGIFFGLMISGHNPFMMFWPPTWVHMLEFLM